MSTQMDILCARDVIVAMSGRGNGVGNTRIYGVDATSFKPVQNKLASEKLVGISAYYSRIFHYDADGNFLSVECKKVHGRGESLFYGVESLRNAMNPGTYGVATGLLNATYNGIVQETTMTKSSNKKAEVKAPFMSTEEKNKAAEKKIRHKRALESNASKAFEQKQTAIKIRDGKLQSERKLYFCPNNNCKRSFTSEKYFENHKRANQCYNGASLSGVTPTLTRKITTKARGEETWTKVNTQIKMRDYMIELSKEGTTDFVYADNVQLSITATSPLKTIRQEHTLCNGESFVCQSPDELSALKQPSSNDSRSYEQVKFVLDLYMEGEQRKEAKFTAHDAATCMKVVGQKVRFLQGGNRDFPVMQPNIHGFSSFPLDMCLDSSQIKSYFGMTRAKLEGVVKSKLDKKLTLPEALLFKRLLNAKGENNSKFTKDQASEFYQRQCHQFTVHSVLENNDNTLIFPHGFEGLSDGKQKALKTFFQKPENKIDALIAELRVQFTKDHSILVAQQNQDVLCTCELSVI